ncbi:hypothetical protein [Bacillus chungangensis]|uniref:Transposase n=1 Tax=Bacillus chungangensis TaxID=587633 RepID=A0ABT9WZN1_9BACI|nr:hypothetical protein [Bacillus chungangensis]MDQ0178548.1 transposase [Bacillus chungangensis]
MIKRKRRTFSQAFKEQMVQLHASGKPRSETSENTTLPLRLLTDGFNCNQASGSFQEKDNRPPEQEELIKLRKQNKQLAMENDILSKPRQSRTKVNVITTI